MTTSLVTGGCGFIGSHIVDRLVELDHNVIVIDDLSAPENEEFYYHENKERVQYIIKDIVEDDCSDHFDNVDWVFHLAARSRIQPTIGDPESCLRVNVLGTQRVLEWSRIHSVRKLIYSGTSSLYGKQNAIPFTPNMPPQCLNPYSMSKWMGEQVCELYYQLYEFNSIVLRYFNVYGPREPLKGRYAPVIGLFKRQELEEHPITIVGNGLQRRDFTYIDDVVDANICAINAKSIDHGIYNVGTGKSFPIIDIAHMIKRKSQIVHIPPRPAEVSETLADIEMTTKDLGWQPRHSLNEKILSY